MEYHYQHTGDITINIQEKICYILVEFELPSEYSSADLPL